jgi:redox-sensitive bicupin YhaK (pirin superfamily)
MIKIIHRAEERGGANHGWLDTRHSFSFANYYNPEKMGFGLLRVLNDDWVAPGMGFGKHPHDNMEIISIPLQGALKHADSTGREAVISTGDVQIMSAGSGITHSEVNASNSEKVNFLQLWIFPAEKNITPRYEQKTFNEEDRKNKFLTVVSPEKDSNSVWINQDAYLALGNLDTQTTTTYKLNKPNHGAYVYVLEGSVEVAGEILSKRDALGIANTADIKVEAKENSQLLIIEVPLQ